MIFVIIVHYKKYKIRNVFILLKSSSEKNLILIDKNIQVHYLIE